MRVRALVSIAIISLAPVAAAADDSFLCPVTFGSGGYLSKPFPESSDWYGSESLAVQIPGNEGVATTRPGARLAFKIFWWSAGFEPGMEEELEVTVRNLHDGANDAVVTRSTNAWLEDYETWTMLTGIHLASAGCWEITGNYKSQSLTFVVKSELHPESKSLEEATAHND